MNSVAITLATQLTAGWNRTVGSTWLGNGLFEDTDRTLISCLHSSTSFGYSAGGSEGVRYLFRFKANRFMFKKFIYASKATLLIVLTVNLLLSIKCLAQSMPAERNPKYNPSLNPRFNVGINPNLNPALNPKFNARLNPTFNAAVNPKFNASLNPKFNASINPKFNVRLNPTFNAVINPKFNSSWLGYNLFNLDAELIGRAVRVDKQFIVLLNLDSDWVGYYTSNGTGGYNWFNLDDVWKGYLVENGQKGFNLFNVDGEWMAFLAFNN